MEHQILVDLLLDVKKDVSEMKKDLSETKEMTYANSIVLDEHARRSEASESRLDLQEEKLEKFMEKMEPVEDHVKLVNSVMKGSFGALKIVGVIVSIIAATLGIIHHFR